MLHESLSWASKAIEMADKFREIKKAVDSYLKKTKKISAPVVGGICLVIGVFIGIGCFMVINWIKKTEKPVNDRPPASVDCPDFSPVQLYIKKP